MEIYSSLKIGDIWCDTFGIHLVLNICANQGHKTYASLPILKTLRCFVLHENCSFNNDYTIIYNFDKLISRL